jgi:hypothetical protein
VTLLLQPVPCVGHEQLWVLPDEVAEAVRAQLADEADAKGEADA